MESVEVKLLNYKFRFKRLRWREEFSIKFEPKQDPYRVILAYALETISGLPAGSVAEAYRVFEAMPSAIVSRVYKIYKGSLTSPRRFVTAGLYKAPEPSVYVNRVVEDEAKQETEVDKVAQRMESTFGKKELDEAREIDQKIIQASGYRGAVRKDPNAAD
jgi:hypothetical protein